MFTLAILIGFYSHIIFFLGILGLLEKDIILLVTISYLLVSFLIIKNPLKDFLSQVKTPKLNILTTVLVALIALQILINLIGALGPELAFDALWYHLTMPKIYLAASKIFNIGGHLYYSAMPQLTEMYYLVSLALGNEIVAKIIHFLFGILSLIVLYKISRLFLETQKAVLTALIFYSNLVVGWMSITAYIDLTRTFFETMSLWAFFLFAKSGKLRWLITLALMIGFAVSAKILSFGSIILYILLISFLQFQGRFKVKSLLNQTIIFSGVTIIVSLPWLLYAYFNTGNPFYPLFSSAFQPAESASYLNLAILLQKTFQIFLLSPDPISPVYTLALPLIGYYLWKRKLKKEINVLIIYIFFYLATLYLTPIESSGRFILPYLPAFSLLFMLLLKNLKNNFIYKLLFTAIIIISLSSIAYRGLANKRFISSLLGKTTIEDFMSKNMEFQVGNFYDIDGYFQKTIRPNDKVLIYGISNLYYVSFPYTHQSWVKESDKFNYILIKEMSLPSKYNNWVLVYQNPLTRVKLWSAPKR